MTSTRLPGKVMEPILGTPMIGRQIERLRRVQRIDAIVLATSTHPTDDTLADYAVSVGVEVIRGALDDVLSRFTAALDVYHPQTVVRLTGDCPLASPTVIDEVIGIHSSSTNDYTSNTLKATYPDGLDVEVVQPEALRWVAANSSDPHELEHVTLGVYRRPELFRVANVTNHEDLSDLRWTVDSADDLVFVRNVYDRLYREQPDFDLPDVLALVRTEPSLSRTVKDAARNAALKGLDTGAMERD